MCDVEFKMNIDITLTVIEDKKASNCLTSYTCTKTMLFTTLDNYIDLIVIHSLILIFEETLKYIILILLLFIPYSTKLWR